jgi:hypothetical protein
MLQDLRFSQWCHNVLKDHTVKHSLDYLTLQLKALWSFRSSQNINSIPPWIIPSDLNLQWWSNCVSEHTLHLIDLTLALISSTSLTTKPHLYIYPCPLPFMTSFCRIKWKSSHLMAPTTATIWSAITVTQATPYATLHSELPDRFQQFLSYSLTHQK